MKHEENIFGCCDLCDCLRPLSSVRTGVLETFLCDECCALQREDIDEEDDQLRYFWETSDA